MGLPWLRKHNPAVDWEKGSLTLEGDDNPESSTESVPNFQKINANRVVRRKWLKGSIIEDTSDELWAAAGYMYSQQIAEKAAQGKTTNSESTIPPQYQQFSKVFSEEESQRLPE